MNGSDGYKQRVRRSIFDDELESYDRELLSSLDAKISGDSKILEREQKIEHSLESVRRRLEADERAFHEKVRLPSSFSHRVRNSPFLVSSVGCKRIRIGVLLFTLILDTEIHSSVLLRLFRACITISGTSIGTSTN